MAEPLRTLLDGDGWCSRPAPTTAYRRGWSSAPASPAVYMTGFGASASLLGQPDVGLLSFDEMAGHARRFVQAVEVP